MGRITKILFIKNAVETLGYFSEQLALGLERLGYDIYFMDYDDLYESLNQLPRFVQKGRTALITFNFIGLGDEEIFRTETGHLLWEEYAIKYINVLVDHPLYFHTRLLHPLSDMTIFCVDKEHVTYLKRFYPGLHVKFLPLAGNVRLDRELCLAGGGERRGVTAAGSRDVWNCAKNTIPYEKRRYDIVFTANYVPLGWLEEQLQGLEKAYQEFYWGIIEDLLAKPAQSVDVVLERHIREELGEALDGDIRGAMAGMVLVDLYVRTYMRGKIVRELAEAGIEIHVFGAGWEQLACKMPQKLIQNGRQISSAACVDVIQNARISLNVQPWFKDGVHDRVFTAMLQQTVSLTDDSRYLRRTFTDGEDIVFFSLEGCSYLPDLVHMLLREEENAWQIAQNGYRKAVLRHTWQCRAAVLADEL